MAKVQLSLPLPDKRTDGLAATPADVAGVTFESKLKSAPASAWAKLGPDVVPTTMVASLTQNNVASGIWSYRATVHDKLGGADLVFAAELDIGVANLTGGGPLSAAVVP